MENAEIAYVLDGDNNEKADGKIAEVVFILDGEIYDDNATYFVLADTDRESGDYDDDDYYWEYENAYVDGQKQSVFVTYDAVNDLYGSPRTVLKEGVLYKATQTIEDGQYISKLEEAAAKVSGEPTAVGDNAFWIDDANDKEHKFDTDEETIYVTVRKLVDVKGNVEWKIDDGDIDDLKDLKSDKNTTYSAKDAWVMKTVDDETARLVYIFWTETEKGDTRDITFTGSDFTVKSESATTSVDGKVATVNDKGMDAKFSISAADGYDLVSVKLEDGTVLTAKDGVYTIKNVTKDMKVEVTTKAIVKADGTVTLNGDGTITVTYEGEMPALEAAIEAASGKLEAQALEGWEDQKKLEKGYTSPADAVEAVPHTLPALWRAEKIVSRSVKAGFNWDSAAGALDKLDEETAELRQAVEAGQPVDSPHGIREELGDTLLMAAKIAQMSGVDPEDALHRACDKFDRRFRAVEEAADKPLPECGEAELLALWNDAKSHDPS